MLKNYLLSWLTLLGFLTASYSQKPGNNAVYGQIILSESKSLIVQGDGYNKDGSKIMHSNDSLAKPENNIIVSCHPLDFPADLTPTPNAYVTQKEQTFIPLVLPVVVGTTVYFVNEDQFFHNVYSNTPRSRFNIGRRPPGNSYAQKIKNTGPVKLSCDIHTHMSGVVLGLDTPYFTRVDKNGHYSVANLPDGKYRLEVFHPQLQKAFTDIIELKGGKKLNKKINLSKP